MLCFRSVKSTPTNARVVQSERERSAGFDLGVFMFAFHVVALLHLLVQGWDSLHIVQPYLLAVILLSLASLFVAQLICGCKATPIIR